MNFLQLFYNLIFKKWNNELNQIEFINFLINLNQSELFNFKYAPRKVKKISDFLSPVSFFLIRLIKTSQFTMLIHGAA